VPQAPAPHAEARLSARRRAGAAAPAAAPPPGTPLKSSRAEIAAAKATLAAHAAHGYGGALDRAAAREAAGGATAGGGPRAAGDAAQGARAGDSADAGGAGFAAVLAARAALEVRQHLGCGRGHVPSGLLRILGVCCMNQYKQCHDAR